MVLNPGKHLELKKLTKERYSKLGEIYCYPLKNHVKFNSDGFYHMLFKSSREKRTVAQQHARLVLVPLIKPVLYNAKRIHETRIDEVYVNGVKKTRTCYSFIEYVGENQDVKVKVVVRKIENGGLYFHSVMKVNKSPFKNKNTLNKESMIGVPVNQFRNSLSDKGLSPTGTPL